MMDAEFEGVPVSATDNYTPTTEAVRKIYTAAPIVKESNRLPDSDIAKNGVRFDRWLAAERAKAVADLANTIADLVQTVDTETDEPLQDWLAEQIWQLLPVEIRRASAARASVREVQ